MSRAFLNEDKFEQAGDELVERPISPHPNHVTPAGLRQLQAETERLSLLRTQLAAHADDPFAAQRKAETERDLRYYATRLESAMVVNLAAQPANEIRFGAIVTLEDEDGEPQRYALVGEDEADLRQRKISWVSPLARALTGHRVGDSVLWRRPAGETTLHITAITYSTKEKLA